MLRLADAPAPTGEWECMECGYIEEGVAARRPPECPDCGAPGQAFEFFPNEEDALDWRDRADETEDEDLPEEFEDEDDFPAGEQPWQPKRP